MLGHVLRRQGIFSTCFPRLLHAIQDTSRQVSTTWNMSGTPWACGDVLSLLNWKRNCGGVSPQEESIRLGSYSKLEEDRLRAINAATLLSSLNAYNFRQKLEELPIEQAPTDYKQLVRFATASGAVATLKDAHRLCEALVASGVVLRCGNRVHINPREVADELLSCLPESVEQTRKLVSELEAELGPLQQVKDELDQKALNLNKTFQYSALFVMILSFTLQYWMTYYEYSWDIVSPFSYFITLASGIIAFFFSVLYDKPLKMSSIRTSIDNYYYRRAGDSFDALKYEELLKKLLRHRRFLAKYSR